MTDDRGHRSDAGDGDDEQLTLFDLGVDVGALKRMRERLASTSPVNTSKALMFDWKHFAEWCASAGRRSLPASTETVELYCVHCAAELQFGMATIERRVWAIARMHRESGQASPIRPPVRELLSQLARERGRAQKRKAAITPRELARMVATLDGRKAAGARDQAILLLGFSTGLRSADLAALRLADLETCRGGLLVHLRREKNDQEGRGRSIGVVRGGRLDAAAAVDRWVRHRGTEPGLLFGTSAKWVWRVVKAAAVAAGLDPRKYGAHSLRAGMMTALDAAGVSLPAIMQRSGHRSVEVASRYVRHRNDFATDPLARKLS